MSEDGFSDGFEEPNIEIQIKTLMGTTFDVKVSLHDPVSAIKKKIFRVEGMLCLLFNFVVISILFNNFFDNIFFSLWD